MESRRKKRLMYYGFVIDAKCVQPNRKTLQDMRELMLATRNDVCIVLVESPPSTYPQQDLRDIAAAFNEFSCRITKVYLQMLSSPILKQLVPALTHLELVELYEDTATPVTQHILPTLAANVSLKVLAVTCDELATKAIIEELPRFIALEQLDLDFSTRSRVGKELMLAAQQYRGIRRLVLEEPQLQELLQFLPNAKVKKLSLWGLAVESTKARDEIAQAMLQNVTIQEVEVGDTVLPCEHIFKRNKLLATVVNKPPPAASVMPLALYRLLQTDLGATPAHALLRGQVLPLLLEHQLPPAAF